MNDLVLAHESYLAEITWRALLTPDLAEVVEQLHCVLDTCLNFTANSDTLFQVGVGGISEHLLALARRGATCERTPLRSWSI